MKKARRRIDWFPFVLLLILIYFGYVLAHQQTRMNELSQDTLAAQQRLEAVQMENQKLKQEVELLDDPSYIEKTAREELGMTKKGEMPYIVKR